MRNREPVTRSLARARARDLGYSAASRARRAWAMRTNNDTQTRPRRRSRRQGEAGRGSGPRSGGASSLRDLSAARQAAQRAAATEQGARARRAPVHHPAPSRGALVQADPPRDRRGDRVSASRRAAAQHQDPEPREAGPASADQSVVRARDADADGVLRVSRDARLGIGLPVAAVSTARVQAREQGSRLPVALQSPPRVLPRAQARARAAKLVRRVPTLPLSRGA